MRVVVMGCGRVGAALAEALSRIGHEVAVIDRDATAFQRLSPDFPGERVLGMGFDRDVLLKAGVEEAGAFAAVSSGDNSNIIAARVAREMFGVQRVVGHRLVRPCGDVVRRATHCVQYRCAAVMCVFVPDCPL